MHQTIKRLRFPNHFSVGRLYVDNEYAGQLFVSEAKGAVDVSENAQLTLKIRADVKQISRCWRSSLRIHCGLPFSGGLCCRR